MAFIPSDAPNLWAWFKASNGILTNANNVTGWQDKSGNGRDLSLVTAGSYPRLSTTMFGGNANFGTPNQSTALYENRSAGMQTSGNMFSLATGGTIYVVFRREVDDPPFSKLLSSALNFSLLREDSLGVDKLFNTVSNNITASTDLNVMDAAWYVARLRVPSGGNTWYISINNSAELPGTMAAGHSFSPGPLLLFGDQADQAVAEIIVYDKDQDVDEKTAVEYYLSQGTGVYTWTGSLPTYIATTRLILPDITMALGDPDLDPGATSNNPAPIQYFASNSNVATIVNGKIHALAVNQILLFATQVASPGYAAAVEQQSILNIVDPVQAVITFSTLAAKQVGDADYVPAATSNSPAPITYTSDNPAVATIVNGAVHIVGAGTANISAHQNATTGYTAATTVVRSLTVTAPVQAVLTFPVFATKNPGSADFAAGATSNSPATINYASDNTAVATVANGVIHIVGPGMANITASQGATSGYTAATSIIRTLLVTNPSLTAMTIANSPNVASFDFIPTWDLSNLVPQLKLVNNSVGKQLVTLTYDYSFTNQMNSPHTNIFIGAIYVTIGNTTTASPLGFTLNAGDQNSVNNLLGALNSKNLGVWTGSFTSGGALTLATTGSPNAIAHFDFAYGDDIGTTLSLASSVTTHQNGATVNGLTNCKFWFMAYGSDGVLFHSGTLSSPDAVGVWTTLTAAEGVTQIQNHIAWGKGYKVIGYLNDGTTTYGPLEYDVTLCRPQGNIEGQANNFGAAQVYLETQCANRRLYAEDQTNVVYQGVAGTQVSKVFKLIYPADDNGTVPTPFTDSTGASTLLIPLGVDSNAYQFLLDIIMDYTFSGSVVRIKYKFRMVLDILCSKSLCSIICGLEKLEAKIQKGTCTAEDQVLLTLLNSKFSRLLAAMQQPACGVNSAALIREIEELGGFPCNC